MLRIDMKITNFMIITDPNDFALVSALYRSSVDGRRFMYEAVLSPDGEFDIPDNFTSRTAEILQVYLKSLGVRMETIIDDDEQIGDEDDLDVIGYKVGPSVIFCTSNEWYYLKKLRRVYKRYIAEHPNEIDDDMDEVWDYIMDHLPFKKKDLTDNIINMFRNNIDLFRHSF